ncbi:MAG: hypothetical protein ABIR16_00180 [Dokdonella sp.]
MSSPSNEQASFVPLGNYKWPALPTQETVRRIASQFSERVVSWFRKEAEPAVAKDKLHRITRSALDNVVSPPSCGPLIRELDDTVSQRVASNDASNRMTLIVLPPCDGSCVIRTWASENGHDILEPPSRDELLNPADVSPLNLDGDGSLVIPRLEQWFLRHHDGLRRLRRLLLELDRIERPCLIGCNSWAWRFLVAAVDADLLLPAPLTFQAFDGTRLRNWFTELADSDGMGTLRFRLSNDGKDVMALDDRGTPHNDYFQTLAATSYGIPWVAWQLWRRSLRAENGDLSVEAVDSIKADPVSAGSISKDLDEQTIWIADLEEFKLPGSAKDAALLVLQALLIHGELTASELAQVLPELGTAAVLPALRSVGFIERDGDDYRCHPAAYPSIRSGLSAAGFALDKL